MARFLRPLLFGSILLLACSTGGTSPRDEEAPAPPPPASLAYAAHVDARVGTPSFVWVTRRGLPRYATAMAAATDTMKRVAPTFALGTDALQTVGTPVVHDTGAGAIVARFKQRIGDIDVFRGGLAISMNRAFEPISASGLVAKSLAGRDRPFTLTSIEALGRAFATLDLGATPAFTSAGAAGPYEQLTAPGLARPSRAKKVFFPTKDGVVPGWYVEIAPGKPAGGYWSFVVAADDGRVLFKNDLVRHDAAPFTYRVWANPTTRMPSDGPQGNAFAPIPEGRPTGRKLTYVAPELVSLTNYPFSKSDPWLANDATTTRGNNVDAYSDRFGPDGFSPNDGDLRASTTALRVFDATYDTTKSPDATAANIQASITSAFYLTNFLHDWYYDAGWDEKAGNHQQDNLGRGGIGNDPLKVEVMDQSGRNNANAQTPPDGQSPILQMYIFSGPSNAVLTVTGVGDKPVGIGAFGKDQFDLTAPLALAVDGAGGDPNDACEQVTSNLTGKIALVHRGTCSFIQKSIAVQAAGAVGVLIANVPTSVDPNTPPFMGGTDQANDVQIPALSLNVGDGKALEALVGTTARMQRASATDLDGALDGAILSHEWGHVLSNRLVADGNGLTTNQAGGLGEGWADFAALMLQVREEDVTTPEGAGWAGAYPAGSYAMSGQSDIYYGVRRVSYSTNPAIDPLTLKHISNGVPLPPGAPYSFGEDGNGNAEVHNVGEIWATMLHECYGSLLRTYDFKEAQSRMKRYLVSSLSLTPPDPTILEARDAVLSAAYAADEADFQLFWKAFAKRGAGVGAKGPGKDSSDNSGVVESYGVGSSLEVVEASIADDILTCDKDGILDPGEVGTVHVMVRNAGSSMLEGPALKLQATTKGIVLGANQPESSKSLAPFESAVFDIRTTVSAGEPNTLVDYEVSVTDPAVKDPVKVTLTSRYNADESPDASAVDTVQTKKTSWKTAGNDEPDAPAFAILRTGAEGWWRVEDTYAPADRQLVSPKFTIDGNTFSLSFKHRWSFRFSTRRNVDLNGGVVEISTDGKTWKDASELGKIDYNTTLDVGRGDNPLGNRKAYGNVSAGYPDKWITSKVDVTLPARPDAVQVRFRAGSGTGFSLAPGWEIDDITLSGISSTPFWGFVPHADQCDPKGPTVVPGPGLTAKSREVVLMSATATYDGAGELGYGWLQTTGPSVTIAGGTTGQPAFVAPDTDKPVVLSFQVRANDGKLVSAPGQVDVTVVPGDSVPSDDSGCGIGRRATGAGGAATGGLFLLAAGLIRRRRRSR